MLLRTAGIALRDAMLVPEPPPRPARPGNAGRGVRLHPSLHAVPRAPAPPAAGLRPLPRRASRIGAHAGSVVTETPGSPRNLARSWACGSGWAGDPGRRARTHGSAAANPAWALPGPLPSPAPPRPGSPQAWSHRDSRARRGCFLILPLDCDVP